MVETRHAMKSHRREAGFYRQALLIAAPLAILSAFALYSLRLDRASIDQEARAGARILAADLERQCGESVSNGLAHLPAQRLLQGLVIDGQILFPIDYHQLPAPPDWPEKLTPAQMRVWQTAEEAIFQRRDRVSAADAVRSMQAAGLPEAARAQAELSLLLLNSGSVGDPKLAQQFTDLAHRYRKIFTEAGTPLADLALIQALRYTSAGSLPAELSAEVSVRVKSYPSFLTPELLAAAERVQTDGNLSQKTSWLADEETRSLLRSFLQHPVERTRSGEIWFESGGKPFLAVWSPGLSTDTFVSLIPAPWMEEAFLSAVRADRVQIPSYEAVTIQIGDRRWNAGEIGMAKQETNPSPADVLASASGTLVIRARLGLPVVAFNDYLLRRAPQVFQSIRGWPNTTDINSNFPVSFESFPSFNISLTLAHPDLLYALHRQRLWLAAGLILLATAAAGIGLTSAWRSFQRQVRLAEMTSNFVSSVSHELRAPLASVRLMAESLDQGRITDDEKRRDYFRLIVQECRRLSSLVENVLDFSRIRQGRKRYEFEPLDLAALVRQTILLMEPNAGERRVSLILAEPPAESSELQPCWDGQAVQQALVNLIDNAIKHSPAGGAVTVGFEVVKEESESSIRLVVADRGEGIPFEEQEKIFEPFYRSGSELRRETRGIGIGLDIVRHVAEAHGGRVFVESAVGQGSRFTLMLPLNRTAGERG
jgi:signal transduction histidine kinase